MLDKIRSRITHRRFLAFLLSILSIGFLVSLYLNVGMPEPALKLAEDGQVGAFGPLIVKFRQPVVASTVEDFLRLEPAAAGSWTWNGNQAIFRPEIAFQIGETYTLQLNKGARDEIGRSLRADVTWSFKIRAADIVFLGQTASQPEVWLADSAGDSVQSLTKTGGKVRDFAIFPGGDQVVYSSTNNQGGVDLWTVDRSGDKPGKIAGLRY